MSLDFIVPDWPAPANVRALSTTRAGGVSAAPWDRLNLGDHVDDQPASVAENRQRLRAHLPADPVWLRQVHGSTCVDAASSAVGSEADAALSRQAQVVCTVLTADCLPLLFCDDSGSVVAAAHAGWRGLAAGVIESTLAAMGVSGRRIMAWLGPAIGPDHFEVGSEVRTTFLARDAAAAAAFTACSADKWLCDLYLLARQRLAAAGVERVYGGDACTACEAERFYSYRRDGVTGRMASLIWLA